MICKVLEWSPSKFHFDTSKPVGALSRALDNSGAKQLLGWEPSYSLEEGLKETIEWYKKTHSPSEKLDKDILMEHK